jgi:hypothetical protein
MMEMRELQLPADLCESAEKKFAQKFGTVEELLVFILRDLLRDDAVRFDRTEEKLIEDRLRDLGYI